MFGYIKTYKPEMKIREFDAYKAVYCTLCKQLRKDYGFFARFTLNFDYTFLAMIRMAANNTNVAVKKGRCPFNPLAKCNHVCCDDVSLSFSAAVAMLMVYYKLKDTCHDEGIGKRLVAYMVLPFASRWHKKAAKRYPEIELIVAKFCQEQERIEQSDTVSLDAFCHSTALALSKIFSYDIPDESLSQGLERLGYNIGKWVYLVDALDDWQEDTMKKRFNPFIRRLGEKATYEQVSEFALRQLNVCIDEACFAYDQLNLKNFNPIIRNILTLGLAEVQKNVFGKVKQK